MANAGLCTMTFLLSKNNTIIDVEHPIQNNLKHYAACLLWVLLL